MAEGGGVGGEGGGGGRGAKSLVVLLLKGFACKGDVIISNKRNNSVA